MARLVFLYYLFLFSTAGLIIALLLLGSPTWLLPALMMIGLILTTNSIIIVLRLHQ